MKLYDVPRNTWIIAKDDIQVPPGAPEIRERQPLFFHHIDGMYSFCTTHSREEIKEEDIRHLVAWADVEIIKTPENAGKY